MKFRKAKSIYNFCQEYDISRATFYRNIEKMPKTVLIGNQRRILDKDENKWLEKLGSEEK